MSGTPALLVRAAQQLIAEDGWAAATTRRVAERAGVRPGVVHYHVGAIDDLRRRAVLTGVRELFAAPLAEGGDPVATLLDALAALPNDDTRLRLLHESLPAAGHDEELREGLVELLGQFRAVLAQRLGDAPPDVAALVSVAVDGYLLQRTLDPDLDHRPIAHALARLGAR